MLEINGKQLLSLNDTEKAKVLKEICLGKIKILERTKNEYMFKMWEISILQWYKRR